MPSSLDLLGYLAAALTTGAFAPQVWRTWRTRSARDLSLVMLLATFVGNGLWLAYAVAAWAPPIIAANSFTMLLVGALIAMKLGQRDRMAEVAAMVVEAAAPSVPAEPV
jgi:MtN3 and saliva related transmembrane protein